MLVLSVVGSFVSDVSFFSVMEMFVLAIVGFLLRRLRYSLASFAIGLVLATYLEQDVDLTSQIYPHLQWTHRPLSIVLMVVALLILLTKSLEMRRESVKERARIEAKVRGDSADGGESAVSAREITWLVDAEQNPYPLLGVLTTVAIVGVSAAFVGYGLHNFSFATGIMPEMAAAVCGVAGLWRIWVDGRGYYRYRAYNRFRAALEIPSANSESRMVMAEANLPTPVTRSAAGEQTLTPRNRSRPRQQRARPHA